LLEFNSNPAASNNCSIAKRKSAKSGSAGAKHGIVFVRINTFRVGANIGGAALSSARVGGVGAETICVTAPVLPVMLVHLLHQDFSFSEKLPSSSADLNVCLYLSKYTQVVCALSLCIYGTWQTWSIRLPHRGYSPARNSLDFLITIIVTSHMEFRLSVCYRVILFQFITNFTFLCYNHQSG
jgi:hypothetical protein